MEGLDAGKKTFTMTNKQMTEIRNMLAMSGADSRVTRNIIDKLDTALKLMAPEVRANQTASRLVEDMESLVTKGEVCNFLEL